MPAFIDLTGKRFGRWTVLTRVPYEGHATLWCCRCDCGTIATVRGGHLCNGASKSCGCLKKEKTVQRLTRHGHHSERLYAVWIAIGQRCRNPRCKDYPHYGGRGITRCEQWSEYTAFREWALASGYKPGLTIERVGVNGNYCPENCTWIAKAEQGKNTTRTRNNRQ